MTTEYKVFEIGDRVRARAGEDSFDKLVGYNFAPTGTVVGRILGEGRLHAYTIVLGELRSPTVEFVDPENPHLEKVSE